MEEVKKNKNLMPLVIVLLVIIFILGGYIVFDKVLSNKDSSSNTSNNVVDVDDKKVKEEIDDSLMHDGDLFSNGSFVASDYTKSESELTDEVLRWENYIHKVLDYYFRTNSFEEGKSVSKDYVDFVNAYMLYDNKSNNFILFDSKYSDHGIAIIFMSRESASKTIKAYFNVDDKFSYENYNVVAEITKEYKFNPNYYYVLTGGTGVGRPDFKLVSHEKLDNDNVVLHYEENEELKEKVDLKIKKVNNFYRIVSIKKYK